MKISPELILFSLVPAVMSQSSATVVEVNDGTTTTLTGAAASSWESSFSNQLSTQLGSITSSCFPFCSSTTTGLSDVPNGSSLASSIRASVSSALSTEVPNGSSLASSISSHVASAISSASSAGSTATASGNGATAVGTFGGNYALEILLPLGAGIIGLAAVAL